VKPADMNDALMRLPLSDVDQAIGWPMPWLDAYLSHPEPNGFWTRLDLTSKLPELQLPVLHVVGYYDFFSRESVDNFRIMQKQARDAATRRQQRLVLGPWDHGTIGKSQVAGKWISVLQPLLMSRRSSSTGSIAISNRFCGAGKPFPPVHYFRWGTIPGTTHKLGPEASLRHRIFSTPDGQANTRGETAGSYVTHRLPLSRAMRSSRSVAARPRMPRHRRGRSKPPCGGRSIRPLEDRRRARLQHAASRRTANVCRQPRAKLFVSADTPDADWVVKVVDVRPDGVAINLATGILRGRYRNSPQARVDEGGQIYEITVDLGPCAASIAKGHQLRVDICGSLFPLYDRNPNTKEGIFGNTAAVATEQIHHRPEALSRLILPIAARNTTKT
jgi:hypothetical protein